MAVIRVNFNTVIAICNIEHGLLFLCGYSRGQGEWGLNGEWSAC